MADCPWCSKSCEGDARPTCNSCFFGPPSPEVKEHLLKKSGKLTPGMDLSHVKTEEEDPKRKGKRVNKVLQSVFTSSLHKSNTEVDTPMDRMKVKSNSLRNRTVLMYDNLQLFFNDDGIATFPVSDLPQVQRLMRDRPGRFTILEEEKKETPKLEDARQAVEQYLDVSSKKEEKPTPVVKEEKKQEEAKTEEAKKEEPKSDVQKIVTKTPSSSFKKSSKKTTKKSSDKSEDK